MSVQRNKFILPILDTMIDKGISDVQVSMFAGDTMQTWRCLKKLVIVSADQKIIEECEKFIREVELGINMEVVKRGYTQSDVLKKRRAVLNYLDQKNVELFKKLVLLLEENGMLKKKPREIPSNVPPGFFAE